MKSLELNDFIQSIPNQLNPNNDAYWQSRGDDKRPDDWEDRIAEQEDDWDDEDD